MENLKKIRECKQMNDVKTVKIVKTAFFKNTVRLLPMVIAGTLALHSSSVYAAYSSNVPSPSDSPLYYSIGGGDVVPDPPSMSNSISVSISGLGAMNYNCGLFNRNASIANALNGVEDSAMNMFNNAVNSAEGAVMEMPAYIIAKANPSLYQLMQNGLFSGFGDFDLGLKSCGQMQQDIDNGKNPYNGMFKASTSNHWKAFQYGSDSRSSLNQLSYSASEQSDVNQARTKIAESNGADGVQWTHGATIHNAYHAGGDGQPAILLTYDIVMAGVNAMLSNKDYYADANIPKTDSLHQFFAKPSEAAKWAQDVLGEKTITTGGGNKGTQPGKGLLPKVQSQYEDVFKGLVDLVGGSKEINVDNLKAVSTNRLMISGDIIQNLQTDPAMRRSMETSALAQGVAALRVIDKAQELILILQTARQVPSISINEVAQDQITEDITTLNSQIKQIVDNNETNKKLLTSTIGNMMAARAQYVAKANSTQPGGYTPSSVTDGNVKLPENQ
ncbi:integrating conjugative element protein [Cysteiniphilum litorale]|uniref:integrating conjugative element protein n=1 Tax=Cysteiniphilum litorale TaxID=2056700 RepID=UPI003F8816CB